MVKDHHIDGDQEAMKYPEHLKAYFEKHKISEFIEINPKLAEECTKNSEKLVKLDVEKTYKLSRIIELKKEVARIFGLLPTAVTLKSISDGCVIATFHISTTVANLIFPKSREFSPEEEEKFRALSVVRMNCNAQIFDFTHGKTDT
jgi:hypothetical protein